ncbi:MAG: RCC1 domain-containing protein [Burkholderiaceae bacterium]
MTTGVAQCWGYNASVQLGTGDKLNRSVPANVTGPSSSVMAISIGGTSACASVASSPVSA